MSGRENHIPTPRQKPNLITLILGIWNGAGGVKGTKDQSSRRAQSWG